MVKVIESSFLSYNKNTLPYAVDLYQEKCCYALSFIVILHFIYN